MIATQISIGRFHHFHLARQLQKHNLLHRIYTGYPRFKLSAEQGVPEHKIQTFPWIYTLYMARGHFGISSWKWLEREMAWLACESLDKYVASNIKQATTLIALSGSGLRAGYVSQQMGGTHICDRGSAHIQYQEDILQEEYKRWGLTFRGIDRRYLKKELQEYEQANYVTVPSEFARKSFITMGVSPEKIIKIPYGARLERFRKTSSPSKDSFRVLWVGAVGIQKGFLYLLQAFQKLKHPKKELVVIGAVHDDLKKLLPAYNLDNVHFRGLVDNSRLPEIYSSSHVFVLPSIQEGFGMVMGEALACGCPVIGSQNTGAYDLFTDGIEGFIVPIRCSDSIAVRLQQLADDPALRETMSFAAIRRVQKIGGWDSYGNSFKRLIDSINQ